MQVTALSDLSIAVICADAVSLSRAEELAATLGVPFMGRVEAPTLPAGLWLLKVSVMGLAMQQSGRRVPGPVTVDFVGGKMGFRRQRQEPTPAAVKAVGVRPGIHPQVWDLTAGLGEDAFIFAKHGCRVTMFERNPLVRCLLADGLDRARLAAEQGDEQLRNILSRLSLVAADSIEVLSSLGDDERPEVIYIDTMFPERAKSAKVKKGMQLFQQIVGEDPDADQLLELALGRAQYRTVVKRPRHAPVLAQVNPALSITGKSTRFDVYALKKLPRVPAAEQ